MSQAVVDSQGAKTAAAGEAAGAAPAPSDETEAPAAVANGGPPLPFCPPRPPPSGATPEVGDKEANGGDVVATAKGEEEKGEEESTREGDAKETLRGTNKGIEEGEAEKQQQQQQQGEAKEEQGERSGSDAEETEQETEEERERRREQRADVDRHMAKLYITVLQAKHQELSRGGGGEFSRVPRDEDEEEGGGFGSGFARLGVGELPMCDPATVPLDFESARDVFKRAKVRYDVTARLFFFVFFLWPGQVVPRETGVLLHPYFFLSLRLLRVVVSR